MEIFVKLFRPSETRTLAGELNLYKFIFCRPY